MVVAVALLAAAPLALAEDLMPPNYRGLEGSTCQEWDFMTSGDPAVLGFYPEPDGSSGITNNPYDTPMAWVHGPEAWWSDGFGPPGSSGGSWSDFSYMEFYVPNRPNMPADSWKAVRVQVTYFDPFGGGLPPFIEVAPEVGTAEETFVGEVIDLGEDWFFIYEDWHLEPNPDAEWVYIQNPGATNPLPNYAISEVVIDTICVPEPATLALVGLGAAALAARRRRK